MPHPHYKETKPLFNKLLGFGEKQVDISAQIDTEQQLAQEQQQQRTQEQEEQRQQKLNVEVHDTSKLLEVDHFFREYSSPFKDLGNKEQLKKKWLKLFGHARVHISKNALRELLSIDSCLTQGFPFYNAPDDFAVEATGDCYGGPVWKIRYTRGHRAENFDLLPLRAPSSIKNNFQESEVYQACFTYLEKLKEDEVKHLEKICCELTKKHQENEEESQLCTPESKEYLSAACIQFTQKLQEDFDLQWPEDISQFDVKNLFVALSWAYCILHNSDPENRPAVWLAICAGHIEFSINAAPIGLMIYGYNPRNPHFRLPFICQEMGFTAEIIKKPNKNHNAYQKSDFKTMKADARQAFLLTVARNGNTKESRCRSLHFYRQVIEKVESFIAQEPYANLAKLEKLEILCGLYSLFYYHTTAKCYTVEKDDKVLELVTSFLALLKNKSDSLSVCFPELEYFLHRTGGTASIYDWYSDRVKKHEEFYGKRLEKPTLCNVIPQYNNLSGSREIRALLTINGKALSIWPAPMSETVNLVSAVLEFKEKHPSLVTTLLELFDKKRKYLDSIYSFPTLYNLKLYNNKKMSQQLCLFVTSLMSMQKSEAEKSIQALSNHIHLWTEVREKSVTELERVLGEERDKFDSFFFGNLFRFSFAEVTDFFEEICPALSQEILQFPYREHEFQAYEKLPEKEQLFVCTFPYPLRKAVQALPEQGHYPFSFLHDLVKSDDFQTYLNSYFSLLDSRFQKNHLQKRLSRIEEFLQLSLFDKKSCQDKIKNFKTEIKECEEIIDLAKKTMGESTPKIATRIAKMVYTEEDANFQPLQATAENELRILNLERLSNLFSQAEQPGTIAWLMAVSRFPLQLQGQIGFLIKELDKFAINYKDSETHLQQFINHWQTYSNMDSVLAFQALLQSMNEHSERMPVALLNYLLPIGSKNCSPIAALHEALLLIYEKAPFKHAELLPLLGKLLEKGLLTGNHKEQSTALIKAMDPLLQRRDIYDDQQLFSLCVALLDNAISPEEITSLLQQLTPETEFKNQEDYEKQEHYLHLLQQVIEIYFNQQKQPKSVLSFINAVAAKPEKTRLLYLQLLVLVNSRDTGEINTFLQTSYAEQDLRLALKSLPYQFPQRSVVDKAKHLNYADHDNKRFQEQRNTINGNKPIASPAAEESNLLNTLQAEEISLNQKDKNPITAEDLHNHFNANTQDGRAESKKALDSLPQVLHTLRYTLNMTLNETQLAAVEAALKSGDSNLVQGIASGEGKSRILMVLLACYTLANENCHFLTSNLTLAARDCSHFQPFFHALDIEAAVVKANSDYHRYPIGKSKNNHKKKLYFSDPTNMAHFLQKALVEGKLSWQEIADASLAGFFDESDNFMEDLRSRFNLSFMTHTLNHEAYERIFALIDSTDNNTPTVEDYKKLQEIDFEWDEEVVAELNRAYKEAKTLITNTSRYLITEPMAIASGNKMLHARTLQVVDQGANQPGATYSRHTHQLLCARLNQDIADPTKKIHIPSYSQLVSSMTPDQLIGLYKRLYCCTGSPEKGIEQQLAAERYNLTYQPIPRHNPSKLQLKPSFVVNSEAARAQRLLKEVIRALEREEPVLIFAENAEKIEHLKNFIANNLPKKLKAKYNQRIHAITPKTSREEEADIVTKTINNDIIIANERAARGTHFSVQEGKALQVFSTYLSENLRAVEQMRNRTARYGAPGVFRFFLTAEQVAQRAGTQKLAERFYFNSESFIEHAIEENTFYHNLVHRTVQRHFNTVLLQLQNAHFQHFAGSQNRETKQKWNNFLENAIANIDNATKEIIELLDKQSNEDKLKEKADEHKNNLLKQYKDLFSENECTLSINLGEQLAASIKQLSDNQPKSGSTRPLYSHWDAAMAGRAKNFDRLFVETRALFAQREKKRLLFANSRSWLDGEGILFADTRAFLKGEREIFANTRNSYKAYFDKTRKPKS